MSAINSICSLDNCEKPVEAGRQICAMHRSRFKKRGSYELPETIQETICFVDGCDRLRARKPDGRFKGRRCTMHRDRWETYKSDNFPSRAKPTDGVVKVCKVHGELEIHQIFVINYGAHSNSSNKPGYVYYSCKQCVKSKNKAYADSNKSKLKSKYLERDYGITIDQYNTMVTAQNNKCAICSQEETAQFNGLQKSLAVDHCHKNGNVRALLCQACNGGIGHFNDSIEKLEKAIEYLKIHNKKGAS